MNGVEDIPFPPTPSYLDYIESILQLPLSLSCGPTTPHFESTIGGTPPSGKEPRGGIQRFYGEVETFVILANKVTLGETDFMSD